jgi:hypothetical protein
VSKNEIRDVAVEMEGLAEQKNWKARSPIAKNESGLVRGFEPDVNRTRNLLIWSQTRYHCATDPAVVTTKPGYICYKY